MRFVDCLLICYMIQRKLAGGKYLPIESFCHDHIRFAAEFSNPFKVSEMAKYRQFLRPHPLITNILCPVGGALIVVPPDLPHVWSMISSCCVENLSSLSSCHLCPFIAQGVPTCIGSFSTFHFW